jgi:hypothetical protein
MFKPVPKKAIPYLKRMNLEKTSCLNERFQQKTVIVALKNAGRI